MFEPPTHFEISDALEARAVRIAAYATAFMAVLAFGAPWEVGGDGFVWTWDIWSGAEAFYLIPLAAGVLLAVAGGFEAAPGIAVAGGALVAGGAWLATSFDRFEPAFAGIAAGVDDRMPFGLASACALLAGLASRRALHRSIASRVLVLLGGAGAILTFVVPMGPGGTSGLMDGIVDPLSTGEIKPILKAMPATLFAVAALASFATLAGSHESTDGLSTLAVALFHAAAAALAFGHVPPVVAAILQGGPLGYGVLAAPIKVGLLRYTALLWVGLGGGSAIAAAEAWFRRVPMAGYKTLAAAAPSPMVAAPRPAQVAATPAAQPQSAGRPGIPAAPARDSSAVQSAPELGTMPTIQGFMAAPAPPPAATPQRAAEPSGFAAAPRAAPISPAPRDPSAAMPEFHGIPTPAVSVPVTPTPVEIVEVPSSQALPILQPLRPGEPRPAPAPARAEPAARKGAGRTQLGMPAVQMQRSFGGGPFPGSQESGRTGNTLPGLAAAQPMPPAPPAGKQPSDEAKSEPASQRLWPPPGGFRRKPPGAAKTAPQSGLPGLHDAAIPTAPAGVRTDAAARGAAAPAAGVGAPSQEVRQRVSNLQKQLARGAISVKEYQRRLDEILRTRGG